MDEEYFYWLALRHAQFSLRELLPLLDQVGSARALLETPRNELISLIGNQKKVDRLLACWEERVWERDVEALEQHGGWLLLYTDYPAPLRALIDPPLLLYGRGRREALQKPSVGIVGTRAATPYGLTSSRLFARTLAAQGGVAIVSGLARGIDAEAHQGALDAGGTTIACLGSGLSHMYPKEHTSLAEAIVAQGALLSEYPMDTPPHTYHFPRRNRIIGGLVRALLLVEAPLRSGAMNTMEQAKQAGTPLYALPGRWDLPSFDGNHHLIQQGEARLVRNPSEMLSLFQLSKSSFSNFSLVQGELWECTSEEGTFLRSFPRYEITFDELIVASGKSPQQVAALLTGLVLKGAVREFPGNLYQLVGA